MTHKICGLTLAAIWFCALMHDLMFGTSGMAYIYIGLGVCAMTVVYAVLSDDGS